MKPAKPFFFGTNVKMHQTAPESRSFIRGIQAQLGRVESVQLFVIAPHTSLQGLPEIAAESGLWIGAQNMHYAIEGAFTGEISARMLTALNVDLVMLGHAERRTLFGETDVALQKKVQAAVHSGLRVLLCVGENAEEKRFGLTYETLARQLKIALRDYAAEDLPRLMIAYEPVWSIGEGGQPAEPSEVERGVLHIRDILTDIVGAGSLSIPLVYGGSVNPDNCADYAELAEVDGLFVGRSAWSVEGFADVFKRGFDAKRKSRAS
jgi:triosephosphate isomerase